MNTIRFKRREPYFDEPGSDKIEIHKYRITCEHSASSYGIPVIVDESGNAFGDADFIPGPNCTGAEFKSSPIVRAFWEV